MKEPTTDALKDEATNQALEHPLTCKCQAQRCFIFAQTLHKHGNYIVEETLRKVNVPFPLYS
jgi:hypothetical protein